MFDEAKNCLQSWMKQKADLFAIADIEAESWFVCKLG